MLITYSKVRRLISEQRGVFIILYEKDAIESLKYYEQPSLRVGITAPISPWLIWFTYFESYLERTYAIFHNCWETFRTNEENRMSSLSTVWPACSPEATPSRWLPAPAPSPASHPPFLVCLHLRPSQRKVISLWRQIRGIFMQQLMKLSIKRRFVFFFPLPLDVIVLYQVQQSRKTLFLETNRM